MSVTFEPIGIIHTPFTEPAGMPIQPSGAAGVAGLVVLDPAYADGLADLEGFSHCYLIYHFHRSDGYRLRVTPFLDDAEHGVFATRAPRRPNAIGLSVVRVMAIDGATLEVGDVDILDGTPLLDIKPYVPAFEPSGEIRVGWLERHGHTVVRHRSDDRFA